MADELIKKFSRQEFRDFKYFLSRRSRDAEQRVDMNYISDLRAGRSVDAEKSNHAHQTRKRLKKQLEQFVQLENLRFDVTSLSFNHIETATYLFRKQMPFHAWEYLLKAEENSIRTEEYVLLDMIYYIQIAYASNIYGLTLPLPVFKGLLEKRDANLRLSILDANANAAYAEIRYAIRALKYSANPKADIQSIVDVTLSRYKLSEKLYAHPRIYGKIVNLVSRGLAEIGAYHKMADYSLSTYRKIKDLGIMEVMHPDYLMELLLSLCQSQLWIKNYTAAYAFLMIYTERNRVFRHRYDKYNYHLKMQGLIESYIWLCKGDLEEAENIMLRLLGSHDRNHKGRSVSEELNALSLSVYFCQHHIDQCIRIYNKLYQEADHDLSDPGMLVLIGLYGVIFYYEAGETEYATGLLKRLKRVHRSFIKAPYNSRIMIFVRILEKLLTDPSYRLKNRFKEDAAGFIKMKAYYPDNKECVSLNAWLHGKSEGISYYEAFLMQVK